jgi:putative PIN family toxin of toxin-antitoxin system
MKAEHRLRVVIDTNIWISAALAPSGPPAQVVRHVLRHGAPVLSPPTFAELESRLWKPKFDRYLSLEQRRDLLRNLNGAALWTDIPPDLATRHFSRDPEDDKFVQTALAAEAPWLITGDQDLLSMAPIEGLLVCTPAAATAHAVFQRTPGVPGGLLSS